MIKAVINIESPRHHVFSILTDYPRYKEWLPGCERSVVVSGGGDAVETEIVIRSMKKMKLGLRFEAYPIRALNFRMTSGRDIRAYSGSYRLMDAADGNGTVVIAEMEIDAGAMVPKFMVDRIAKKSIDDTGVALRQYARTVLSKPFAEARAAVPAAAARPRRAKRILQVVKTPTGYRLWMMGQTYFVKSLTGASLGGPF